MASLMIIPRELRDMILSFVLLENRPSPQSISEIEQQDRTFPDERSAIYSLTDPAEYRSSTSSLLLTSKQLNAEMREVMHGAPVNYKLDVKFLRDSYLVPTWTSIPVRSSRIDRLEATFQSLGAYQRPVKDLNLKGGPRRRDIWKRSSGRAPLHVRPFYSLLERFLKFGPVGPTSLEIETPGSIDCLELNYVDPEDTSLLPPKAANSDEERECSLRLHMYRRGEVDTNKIQVLRPEWLEKTLSRHLYMLLRMDEHYSPYGAVLYEHIGRIVIKVNGDIVRELDLGEMLGAHRFQDEANWYDGDRLRRMNEWRDATLVVRAERGLKVVEPNGNWWEQPEDEGS